MTPFEEAMAELKRKHWTALNIIGKSSDWGSPTLQQHVDNCELFEYYKSLNDAIGTVVGEWIKIKKKLDEKAFENLLKNL